MRIPQERPSQVHAKDKKAGRTRVGNKQRWLEIWDQLFPGVKQPISPFVDPYDHLTQFSWLITEEEWPASRSSLSRVEVADPMRQTALRCRGRLDSMANQQLPEPASTKTESPKFTIDTSPWESVDKIGFQALNSSTPRSFNLWEHFSAPTSSAPHWMSTIGQTVLHPSSTRKTLF
ncbi:uncharacterized protein BCR38DRAFT_414351 [Pseudomassariella vexata]|uniref:Uncharacterized protein n=1 Tax=Pseudomassariella vexata TaxID=1141098 RepID=A0A1Y2DD28_9PEZI|nr:uncharacterized protein BCR38DRAFT_414351 [Pseudomassariella vexata]ORY56595.1 hypothetical protein BCR38DRAFT_414351 [Pseudomassariella vexata]